jgi:hypothetical protein
VFELIITVVATVVLLLLVVTTTLAVYKPRGLTPWGSRNWIAGAKPAASDAP